MHCGILKRSVAAHTRAIMGHAICRPIQRVGSLDVCRAGSEGLKDQPPRSCPEWLLDSHGTREMLNDGNMPLGQEPWELSVRNWLPYATGELQCTFGNEVAL